MNTPLTQAQLDAFCASLTARIDAWLASGEAAHVPAAGLYRHLPDLFRFLAEVALDRRLAESARASALSAVEYVMAPYDLIPEAEEGVPGFRDDLSLAATTVDRLCDTCDPVLVSAHWRGLGTARETARSVLTAAGELAGRM